ncbi:lactate dehydrogenase [Bellilinea caldifistulae]|uniref:Glyoxylate reductase n=1 Tax=Bellilinea caldifistulae TaxID=360411 RepID=A0A0P6XF34_9CHLR|nr:D-glycerate dehydrogenase [Bellilinea caldifistulae]KPL73780.1 glyoxylate reductase [Bellilinea caldifistulae]GAP11042.1 lactate dehydrogenase [Bellilinea caldifistulae]
MNKPAVWLTRRIYEPAVQKISTVAQVEIWPAEYPPPPEVILEKVQGLDGLLTMLTDPITAAVIENAPHLKVISQMAVGFDNIDIQAATRHGIPVGHTPGVLTETTADFAWALLMAAARRVVEADREVHQGIWRAWGPDVLTGMDVHGATLGIIGFGRIGKAVARRALGFSMKVLYNDPKRDEQAEKDFRVEYRNLDDLLQESDFISLHTYYTPQLHHLINRQRFEQMKDGAILINTARGGLVDYQALYWALESKKLAAAALDVFDPEPIPPGHPLLHFPNLIITPHIASASTRTRQNMALIAAENLIAGLRGEKLTYCANPQVYNV